TLKILSKIFDVSINTLLGSPQKLICQCCGMPLDDSSISKEPDGTFNEEYCKWCYTNGDFAYKDINVMIDFLAEHMSNDHFPKEQAKAYFKEQIPKLNYWKNK
ncbi:MAG: zinc ribbon domain-containing protein, partial [Eubacterium sp.]|nr:zinc ribbon domain-containing protein [Eubacterium sp.]